MIVKASKVYDHQEGVQEELYVPIPKQVYELQEGDLFRIFVEWVDDKPRIIFEPAS